ncbi:MAG: phosphatase, partial [Nitrosospira sp.]|nr:phosphatase [Nitrosospira sp.]
MFKQTKLSSLVSGAFLVMAGATQAIAANTQFDNFTALPNSVAAGSLPEEKPFQLSSPLFSQHTLDANTLPGTNERRGDNWDMITANETGPDAGRYLFSPYETDTAGVKRYDLQTGNSLTVVAEGTQGFVGGDASYWTPWGSYLTAEEEWEAGGTKGRLFELTNSTTTTGPATSDFVSRDIIPRVSHEGLAFDKNNDMYFIDEFNGGSIYKYVSANPNAADGDGYFAAGQTFAMLVDGGNNANATGAITWAAITDVNGGALTGVSVVNNG